MSVVGLLGVNILNNPAKFTDKYEFEITFECHEQLEKGKAVFHLLWGLVLIVADLEWKLTYVGSATS